MADDHEYPVQIDVDEDDYYVDEDSSSEVESSDVQTEEVEQIVDHSPHLDIASAMPPPDKSHGNGHHKSKHDQKHHVVPDAARAALRSARNLDVEVTGPTEDVCASNALLRLSLLAFPLEESQIYLCYINTGLTPTLKDKRRHLFLEGSLLTPWGRGATSFNPNRCFCRLADMVFYVYSTSSSSHPRKFLDCETLLDIQPGSLSLFEFKLIDKNKREYKLRATNQQDFGAWVKAFQAALARRQRAANKTIKVWFMDISKISIVIERGVTTAEDLWWLVCEALSLSDDSRDAFCIWIMGADLQVQLCNDDVITTVLEDWHTAYEQKYSSKLEGPPRLVFRTAPSLTLSAERNMKDTKAVHLFYLQAAYNVLYHNYVVDLSTAIILAGLAAQIRLGDYDRSKHAPGYIVSQLRRYIPSYLSQKHKKKASTWDSLIQKEHASHRGKTLLICEMLYLQRCRTIPYYGSIFFPTKNRDKARESGYWSQQTEGVITLGINMEGIHITRDLKPLHTYTWQNILHWEVEQGKYFYFTGNAIKPGQGRVKKRSHTYLLETKAAPLIKEHLQDFIYEIKRQERIVSKIRKEQETAR